MNNRPFTTAILVVLFSVINYQTAHALLYQTRESFNYAVNSTEMNIDRTESKNNTLELKGFNRTLGSLNSVDILIEGGASLWTWAISKGLEDSNNAVFNHDAWTDFSANCKLFTTNETIADRNYAMETDILWQSPDSEETWTNGGPIVDTFWTVNETGINASEYFSRFGDSDVSYFTWFEACMNSGGSTLSTAYFNTDWKMTITHVYDYTPVPEPAGLFLFCTGLFGLVGTKYRHDRLLKNKKDLA